LAISKISERFARANKMAAHGVTAETKAKHATDSDSGEVIAAIGLALRDHFEAHDQESTVLTINKVRRSYSPWSSKIYGMRHNPRS
ncbi:MAG: OadG family protein, partial [Muribaculaceae bacterium]|nr:OadG family protein [Muribaculaceae bacterium]